MTNRPVLERTAGHRITPWPDVPMGLLRARTVHQPHFLLATQVTIVLWFVFLSRMNWSIPVTQPSGIVRALEGEGVGCGILGSHGEP